MGAICSLLIEAMEHMEAMLRAGHTLRASARSAARVYPMFPALELLRYFVERP